MRVINSIGMRCKSSTTLELAVGNARLLASKTRTLPRPSRLECDSYSGFSSIFYCIK